MSHDPENLRAGQTSKPATRSFSIRLTETERRTLTSAPGRVPLGTYIRQRLLSDDAEYARTRWKQPLKDQHALASVLARLGQSQIWSGMIGLAEASRCGALPVSPEIESQIGDACTPSVSRMRRPDDP